MQGWLFDVYPDHENNVMVTWTANGRRAVRRTERFTPRIYVGAPMDDLRILRGQLEGYEAISGMDIVQRLKDIRDTEPSPVLEISIGSYGAMGDLARLIDAKGGFRHFTLYDVDQSMPFRYLTHLGLFPNALVNVGSNFELLDDRYSTEYAMPELRAMAIERPGRTYSFEEPLGRLMVEGEPLTGTDEEILSGLKEILARSDPDVILTDGGDKVLLPYLQHRAALANVPLYLDRDRGVKSPFQKKEKSYFSYGRIVYKPAPFFLKGRAHLDRASFMYAQGALPGVVEISRLSGIPLQQMSRLSPGTAISSMQMRQAMQDGVLIMWKKNIPEMFKSARGLIDSDRGGFIFEPKVGLFEGVVEVDFTSLYPFIIANKNISPETVMCPCCPDTQHRVPVLGYGLCEKRRGLIPKVLEPIIARRVAYKRKAKLGGPEADGLKQRADALKWVLVTCLDGNTLVPYEKNGVRYINKISDIVDRYMPDNCGELRIKEDIRVFGFDENMASTALRVKKIFKFPSPEKMLRVRLQQGRELVMTKDHPCYILKNGELKIGLAEGLKTGEYLPVASSLPLQTISETSIDIAVRLEKCLPPEELPMWRAFGPRISECVARQYTVIRDAAKDHYSDKSIWNWREYGYLPLQYRKYLPTEKDRSLVEEVGRGRRGGGEVQRIPSKLKVDFDLGFFLGYFVGDGNAKKNMVRFAINLEDTDVVEKLQVIIQDKFHLPSHVRKEKHANMFVLQVNSVALKRILEVGLGVAQSAPEGKLDIPSVVLNGSRETQYGFISGVMASDGSVSQKRNFAGIATADLTFAKKVGMLFSMVGLEYRLVIGKRLHGVQCRNLRQLSILMQNGWLKAKHRERVELKVGAGREIREWHIPVEETGIRYLSEKARATREPRVTRVSSIPRDSALLKLDQLKEHRGRLSEDDLGLLSRLDRLLHSELTFCCIDSIEEVSPRTPYVYCVQVDDGMPGFVIEGNVFTHNCFGYTGYRNARFGRIECHESINAFGREILLDACHTAQDHGFEVLHGIVDSMWLKGPTHRARECAEAIGKQVGIPLDVEGTYKWLVFLPNKGNGVGALNRYYGAFEDGHLKVRGVEVRKRDTPRFFSDFQSDALDILARARDGHEFLEMLPECLDLARERAQDLRFGEAAVEDLVFTRSVSGTLEDYKTVNLQACCLYLLEEHGIKVAPGQSVRFVVSDDGNPDPRMRVTPDMFLGPDTRYDSGYYLRHLARTLESITLPFGWTEERIMEKISTA